MWALAIPTAGHAADKFIAALDRETVTLGENVILTLTFEGAAPTSAPSLPPIPNLRVLGAGKRVLEMVDGGDRRTQTVFSYTINPIHPGTLTIPPMQFSFNGQVLTTQQFSINVLAPTPPPPEALTNRAWLKLVLPKTNIFRGEILPVDIVLYVAEGQNAMLPQIQSPGFTMGNVVQQQQRRAQFGNNVVFVVPYKSYVSAINAGPLILGPATMVLEIPAPNSPRTIFGAATSFQRVTLESESVPVYVAPLPEHDVPETFNGAVGNFTLAVKAAPTNLIAGDPITLAITISGRGALDSLTLPEQTHWKDFKVYAPSATVHSSDAHHLVGAKQFEQVVIPQNSEITFLPSFLFSYFDVDRRSYVTLSNQPVRLKVSPTVGSAAPPPSLTNAPAAEAAPELDDILHIKAHLHEMPAARPVLLAQAWFLGLQAVPILAWVALFIARKRSEVLTRNPRILRQRAVAKAVRQGLIEMRGFAERGEAEAFYATLFRLLQEQLGERLDLPASAITEAVVERLALRGLAPGAMQDLQALFQACNQARYSAHRPSQELKNLLPVTERTLSALQSLPT